MIDNIPPQNYFVITGGLSGIGLETIKTLNITNPNSKIIITSRDYNSGLKKFKKLFPKNNNIELLELDLAKDNSVDEFLKKINYS